MRLTAKAFVFSLSIMMMLSRTTYSQQNKYQNPIKSATYLSKIDGQGNSVPLYETYIHHWFALRYHVSKDKNMSHDSNDPFGGRIFKRNYGTCNGGILPYYWGMGSESRGTSSKIPDPFVVELGNHEHIPKGWEEKWLFSLMFIDTLDIHGKPLSPEYKGGVFCCENHFNEKRIPSRKLALRYIITWVDWDQHQIPDGRTLCTSKPKYGTGKEAGNEEGYVVGMFVCYPKLGSIWIMDGETVTVESRYKNEFFTGAMRHMYLYLADRLPDTINTSNSYNL
ncbi:hypothetical protein QL285_001518 [Trifolium repens]|nr:hypothetical protein QL285_001518 [Trifolium repens]